MAKWWETPSSSSALPEPAAPQIPDGLGSLLSEPAMPDAQDNPYLRSALSAYQQMRDQARVKFTPAASETPTTPAEPPEPEAGKLNMLGGLADVGRLLYDIPTQTRAAWAGMREGGEDPYAVIDEKDAAIQAGKQRLIERQTALGERANERILPFLPLTRSDVVDTSGSTGFSAVSAGAGLAAGIPAAIAGNLAAPLAGTVAGLAAGGSASGTAAFHMAQNAFLREGYDALSAKKGAPLTPEEWQTALPKLKEEAVKAGLWEAIPEAASNIVMGGVGGKLLKNWGKEGAKKVIAAVAELYGTELATETATQIGQHNAATRAGINDGPERSFSSGKDLWTSLKEVAPQVFILTSLMGGAGAAGGAIYHRAQQQQQARSVGEQATQRADLARLALENLDEPRLLEAAEQARKVLADNPKMPARQRQSLETALGHLDADLQSRANGEGLRQVLADPAQLQTLRGQATLAGMADDTRVSQLNDDELMTAAEQAVQLAQTPALGQGLQQQFTEVAQAYSGHLKARQQLANLDAAVQADPTVAPSLAERMIQAATGQPKKGITPEYSRASLDDTELTRHLTAADRLLSQHGDRLDETQRERLAEARTALQAERDQRTANPDWQARNAQIMQANDPREVRLRQAFAKNPEKTIARLTANDAPVIDTLIQSLEARAQNYAQTGYAVPESITRPLALLQQRKADLEAEAVQKPQAAEEKRQADFLRQQQSPVPTLADALDLTPANADPLGDWLQQRADVADEQGQMLKRTLAALQTPSETPEQQRRTEESRRLVSSRLAGELVQQGVIEHAQRAQAQADIDAWIGSGGRPRPSGVIGRIGMPLGQAQAPETAQPAELQAQIAELRALPAPLASEQARLKRLENEAAQRSGQDELSRLLGPAPAPQAAPVAPASAPQSLADFLQRDSTAGAVPSPLRSAEGPLAAPPAAPRPKRTQAEIKAMQGQRENAPVPKTPPAPNQRNLDGSFPPISDLPQLNPDELDALKSRFEQWLEQHGDEGSLAEFDGKLFETIIPVRSNPPIQAYQRAIDAAIFDFVLHPEKARRPPAPPSPQEQARQQQIQQQQAQWEQKLAAREAEVAPLQQAIEARIAAIKDSAKTRKAAGEDPQALLRELGPLLTEARAHQRWLTDVAFTATERGHAVDPRVVGAQWATIPESLRTFAQSPTVPPLLSRRDAATAIDQWDGDQDRRRAIEAEMEAQGFSDETIAQRLNEVWQREVDEEQEAQRQRQQQIEARDRDIASGEIPLASPAPRHAADDYSQWNALTDDQVKAFAKAAGVKPRASRSGTLGAIDELSRTTIRQAWDKAFSSTPPQEVPREKGKTQTETVLNAESAPKEASPKATSSPASEAPSNTPLAHHYAIYNGKAVAIDYIAESKNEFKRAGMRIRDNGAEGYIITPKREVFKVSQSNKTARKVTDPAEQQQALAQLPTTPQAVPTPPQAAAPEAPVRPADYGANNTLVTTARAEEVRKRLKAKLSQLNAGIDPELLALGTELAAYHLEASARKFVEFAQAMAADLETTVEQIKPFLRAWYNGARDLMEDSGLDVAALESPDQVKAAMAELTAAGKPPAALERTLNPPLTPEQNDDTTTDRSPSETILEGDVPQGLRSLAAAGNARRRGPRRRQADADGNGNPANGRNDGAGGVASQPGVLRDGKPDAGLASDGLGSPGGLTAPSAPREIPGQAKSANLSGENPGNYRITDADRLGEGGNTTKVNQNLAAIRLVKSLETAQRFATPEEQSILAKYVGWGGLKGAFSPNRKDATQVAWFNAVRQLVTDGIWTEAEYKAASMTIADAHYTSPAVIGAMYRFMRHLGFSGGNVLEPTVGSGNFIGLMPEGMSNSSQWFASEIDPTTSAIAKHLYPNAQVKTATPFERAQFPYGKFDLAIGNPPFGATRIKSTESATAALDGWKIHNFIIGKSALHVRPGGVMAMVVTSRFLDTMDRSSQETRAWLDQNMWFLGAVRLPNTAFKKNAGTEVTTDIVFFMRPDTELQGQVAPNREWLKIGHVGEVPVNGYFAQHPELMFGKPTMTGSLYGDQPEFTLEDTGLDIPAEFDRALGNQFAALNGILSGKALAPLVYQENREDIGIGGYLLEGDTLLMREDNDAYGNAQFVTLTPQTQWTEKQTLGETRYQRLKGLMQLRGMAYALVQAERTDAPNVERLRAALRGHYQTFVQAFGVINDSQNSSLLNADPKIEFALEKNVRQARSAGRAKKLGLDARPATADMADILLRRVYQPYQAPTSASNAVDGYAISLSERGKLDLAHIAGLTGTSIEAVISELSAGENPRIFLDPETQEWTRAETYLSGNVKRKLKKAQAAELTANITALQAALPPDIPANAINVEMGAPWVPESVYDDFLKTLGASLPPRVMISSGGTLMMPDASGLPFTPNEMNAQWGNSDYSISEMFLALANKQPLVAYDYIKEGGETRRVVNPERTKILQPIGKAILKTFSDWVMADPERAGHLARVYNEKINTTVDSQFNGDLLRVVDGAAVGANPSIKLRPNQKRGAWRIITSPSVLLDHVVGAGKTNTIIAGVMERRRMGLSKKPLIVVPNHLVGQWAKDWLEMYPGAKLLAATKDDFKQANRRKLIARMATGDYDAIIIGHSMLAKMPVSPETRTRFVQQEVAFLERIKGEMIAAGMPKRKIAGVDLKIKNLQQKLEAAIAKDRKDQVLFFEDTGIDHMTVDESHYFKNLGYHTQMQAVAGMNDPKGSKMAFDLYMKTGSLHAQGGGVVFATGTPISNSLVEMYAILRYLNPQGLTERTMDYFDAWLKTFAGIEEVTEYTATNALKSRNVLTRFHNIPELLQMYRQFADTVTMDDLKRMYREAVEKRNAETGENERTEFPVPHVAGGQRQLITVPISAQQRLFVDYLTLRAQVLETLNGKERQDYAAVDNPLWIYGDARKAALDIRIIDPTAPDESGSKVNRAVENIKAVYDRSTPVKGTQLIFSDLSTPTKNAGKDAAKFIQRLTKVLNTDWHPNVPQLLNTEPTWNGKWRVLLDLLRGDLDTAATIDGMEDYREALEKALESVSEDDLSAIQTADTGFSVYDDIRAKLIRQGVPAQEIAFIHDYNSQKEKQELFDRVNAGEVRILLGSTQKMGAGTNVQERAVALHHMDAPWRPSDMEQREGRVIRQKNALYLEDPDGFRVEIFAYSTEQTFDAVMWQVLTRKAKALEQFRSGTRSVEEVNKDSASYADFMAETTGNAIFREKFELEKQIAELESLASRARLQTVSARNFLQAVDARLQKLRSDRQDAETTLGRLPERGSLRVEYSDSQGAGHAQDLDVAEVLRTEKEAYRQEQEAYLRAKENFATARASLIEAIQALPHGVKAKILVDDGHPEDVATGDDTQSLLMRSFLAKDRFLLARFKKAVAAGHYPGLTVEQIPDREPVRPEWPDIDSKRVVQKLPLIQSLMDALRSHDFNQREAFEFTVNALPVRVAKDSLMPREDYFHLRLNGVYIGEFPIDGIVSKTINLTALRDVLTDILNRDTRQAERLENEKIQQASLLKQVSASQIQDRLSSALTRYQEIADEVNLAESLLARNRHGRPNPYVEKDQKRSLKTHEETPWLYALPEPQFLEIVRNQARARRELQALSQKTPGETLDDAPTLHLLARTLAAAFPSPEQWTTHLSALFPDFLTTLGEVSEPLWQRVAPEGAKTALAELDALPDTPNEAALQNAPALVAVAQAERASAPNLETFAARLESRFGALGKKIRLWADALWRFTGKALAVLLASHISIHPGLNINEQAQASALVQQEAPTLAAPLQGALAVALAPDATTAPKELETISARPVDTQANPPTFTAKTRLPGETALDYFKSDISAQQRDGKKVSMSREDTNPRWQAQAEAVQEKAERGESLTPMEQAWLLFGQQEGNNAQIQKILDHFGSKLSQDQYPWCAPFVAYTHARAGVKNANTASARAFLSKGVPIARPDARPGDVVVLWNDNPKTGGRTGYGGHVGYLVQQEGDVLWVLGGNQGDAVNVTMFHADRVLGIRRIDTQPTPKRVAPQRFAAARPSGVTSEQDAAYLDAVERGDLETAQRMVNEAARDAGYTIGPVYHGTVDGKWTVFRKKTTQSVFGKEGYFFSFMREIAEQHARKAMGEQGKHGAGRIITAYLRDPEAIGPNRLTNGVVEYVVSRATQIKSADPVAYDNAGNVIPLSQRFNPRKQDIRFAAPTPAAVTDALQSLAGNALVQDLLKAGTLRVVARQAQLPASIVIPAGQRVAGAVDPDTGVVYLIAENIAPDEIAGFLAHEVGVHQAQLGLNQPKSRALRLAHALIRLVGARQILGDASFNDALAQLQRMRATSKPVQAAYAAAQHAMGSLNQSSALLHEEALAYLVQNHPKTSLAQQIIAAVRAFLYKAGLKINLTENDLQALAVSALRSASRGRLRAGTITQGARGQNSQDVEAQRQYDAVVARYTLPDGTKAPGWMQAPNGQPTKLTERQWVQVRTENFKRWFGDWEIAASTPVREAATFDEARKAAKAFQGQPLINSATGFVATVSRNGLDKMLSSKAVSKSETPATHALAVANLDRLFERAVLGWSKPDSEGDPNIKAIHRFFAPMLVDGRALLTKMTVKQTVQEGKNNPLYTVEAIHFEEIKNPAAQWVGEIADADGIDPRTIRSAGLVSNLAERVQKFNPADVSQVIDANGEPLVSWHSSDAKGFTVFREGPTFFGSDMNRAKGHRTGGEVRPFFLNIKNPEYQGWQGWLGLSAKDVRQMRKDNIDGVQQHGGDWITFDPTQIKSAIGNTGAFSPDTADIRYAYALGQAEPNLTAEEVLRRVESGGEVTAEEFALLQAYLPGASRALTATGVDAPSFKDWFGASKIKGKAGQPLKMYHGTATDFTVFDAQKAGGSTKHPTAALGFFFTNNRAHAAEKYGDRVMEVYLSLERPYLMTDADLRRIDTLEEALAFRKRLEQQGYDGIVMPAETKTRYVVAFRPDQIKRTTNETYTRGEPDMRFALANPRSFTPAQQAAMDKIGRREPQGWGVRFAGLRERIGLKLRQAIADHHAALLDLDRQAYGNDVVENQTAAASWVKARLSRSVDGPLHLLLHETGLRMDADGALDVLPTVKGLQKVLEPLGVEADDFMKWVAGNRAERLMQEGRENLFTPTDIAALKTLNKGTMADGRNRATVYASAFKDFVALQKSVMDIAEQSGLIDGNERHTWEYDFYVPFYRIAEETQDVRSINAGDGLVRQEAFKRLKGGKDRLNDLLENTVMNWKHLLSASLKNNAARQALTNAQRVRYDGIPVAEPLNPAKESTKGAVYYRENGQPQWFRVNDPLVLEAITALDFTGLQGPVMRVMRQARHLLTRTTTISPAFKVANLLRDTLQTLAVSKISAKTGGLGNIWQGWHDYAQDSVIRRQLLAGGGAFLFGSTLEDHAEAMKKLLAKGVRPATILDTPAKLWEMLSLAYWKYEALGDRLENVNRAALYEQLRKQGKSHLYASFQARDLLDFSQSGASTAVRFLTAVVPFLNARIQGLDKLGRAASQTAQRGRFAVTLAAVALASAALYLLYHDDDDFKQREEWDRDTYWWFKIGDTVFRIPKPFEVGALATLLGDRVMEQLVDSEATPQLYLDRLKHTLTQTFSLSMPQLIAPAVDVWRNKGSFTQRPIETMAQQRLSPALRQNASTSDVARGVSMASGYWLSPVQADYLIAGYFGWLGRQAVLLADHATRPLTDRPTPERLPVFHDLIQRFVPTEPGGNSKYLTRFYEVARTTEQHYADIQEWVKRGEIDAARELVERHREDLARLKLYRKASTQLNDWNNQLKILADFPASQISDDQRKTARETLQAAKLRLARALMEGQPVR